MRTQETHRRRTVRVRLRHGTLGVLLVLAAAACQDEPTGTANGETPGGAREGKYHVGYVLGPDGRPEKIVFQEMGGDAVVEGDVVIGRAADIPRTPEAARTAAAAGRRFSVAVGDTDDYWPGGVVLYQIKANASAATRENTPRAMELINRRIDGVTFVQTASTNQPYMLIQDDNNTANSCRAEVGMQATTVLNVNGCGPGVIAHEIMHGLGFHHEQKRCDRDDYIDITSTLASSAQWSIRCGDGDVHLGTPYDLASIMHYDASTGFNGTRVDLWLARERMDASALMGQRDSLSDCDNAALDVIYPSTGTPSCSRPYVAAATYHTASNYWSLERGVIVDELDPAFTTASSWGYSSGSSNRDYRDHHYHSPYTRTGWYTFEVPADVVYNVYAWTFQKNNATPATAVYKLFRGPASQVTDPANATTYLWEWDQSQGLGWSLLGKASLTPGTYTLQIQKKGGGSGVGNMFVDAIRVTQDSNDPVN